MNLKSKIVFIITIGVLLFGSAVLVWAKQADRIKILGAQEKQLVTKTVQSEEDWLKGEFNGTLYSNEEGLKLSLTQDEYTLQWTDEFDNKTDRWTEADWTFAESECEFSKNNISFDGGQLKLELTEKGDDRGKYTEKPYWGGEYYSTQEYSYGKYVVKMKPNSPPGVVSSFFLIHNDASDWREIDIEFPGKTNQVQYNVRWMEEGKTSIQDDEHLVDLGFDASEDFHEYTIEWTPEFISFLVDGKLSYQYTDPKIVNEIAEPMSVRMNYWISNSPEWAGSFNKSVLPLETYYDSVSYYELNR